MQGRASNDVSQLGCNVVVLLQSMQMHHQAAVAGQTAYWEVFQEVYRAVMQHYRSGPWYDDADIVTGHSMHQQFQSLQAFWPGQTLAVHCILPSDVLAILLDISAQGSEFCASAHWHLPCWIAVKHFRSSYITLTVC